MATMQAQVILTAVDRASAVIQRLGATMAALNGGAAGATRGFSRLGAAATGPGSYGAAMLSGAFLKSQYDFEYAFNRIAAISETTRESLKPMRKEFLRIAETVPVGVQAMADAAVEMAQSGLSPDTIKALMEQVAKGALASGDPLKEVADGMSNIARAMGLPFKTAEEQAKSFEKINNTITAANLATNQTFGELRAGLQKAAPVAAQLGIDVESLTAFIGALGTAGIKGEEAGTGMRAMMTRLVAPTKKARDMMRLFGVDTSKYIKLSDRVALTSEGLQRAMLSAGLKKGGILDDKTKAALDAVLSDPGAKGDLLGTGEKLNDILASALKIDAGDIEGRGKLIDAVQRYMFSVVEKLDPTAAFKELREKGVTIGAMKEIFGLHHIEKGGALMAAIERGEFSRIYDEILRKSEGAVDRFSAKMTEGYVGAVMKLSAAIQRLNITLGETGVLDTVSEVADRMSGFLDKLSKTNPELLRFGTIAVLAIGALAPLGFALAGIGAGLAVLVSPLAWLIAALSVGAYKIYENWSGIKEFFSGLWEGVIGYFQSAYDQIKSIVDQIIALVADNKIVRALGLTASAASVNSSGSGGSMWGEFGVLGGGDSGLIRDTEPTAGPPAPDKALSDFASKIRAALEREPVAKLEGKGTVSVHVKVDGPGRVTGASATSTGDIKLETGASMPDTAK
ncbi:MAG: phage tail tape measure protein [Hyphomicrobiales bacterium]|nr:phage tail tape measure protein [Hyphomicrobiales bacterium]